VSPCRVNPRPSIGAGVKCRGFPGEEEALLSNRQDRMLRAVNSDFVCPSVGGSFAALATKLRLIDSGGGDGYRVPVNHSTNFLAVVDDHDMQGYRRICGDRC
jgi:hypothetical protein